MSYASVAEVWGEGFGSGHFASGLFAQPPNSQLQKQRDNQSNQSNQRDYGQFEHFNGNSGEVLEDSGYYGKVPLSTGPCSDGTGYNNANIRKQYTLGKSDTRTGSPYGFDQTVGAPRAFYPLDEDAGKPNVLLNYSNDNNYAEEEQLRDPAAASSKCSTAFQHLTECRDCRFKLIAALQKQEPVSQTEPPSVMSKYLPANIDMTELALFIVCGVFFIFLLDAIVKVSHRFMR